MKIKLFIYILLTSTLINILMPNKVSAEPLIKEQFEKLSIDEGLSNEHVTTIFQDSKGYMWIGTVDGLNRYDGNKIKIYNSSNENRNTLSSTYIMDVEEDSYGNIWIATDCGLDFFIRDTDTIIRMKDISTDKYNLGKLKITSLLRSTQEENVMWVGTENGLMKIDIKNNSIKAFYKDENDVNSLSSSYITCLEEDENTSIWVGTNYGLNIIDKDYKIIQNEFEGNERNLFIYSIEKDTLGNVAISTKEGIFVYNTRETEKVYLWIADNDGIKKYDTKEKSLKYIYNENLKVSGILNNSNFIMTDSKNNIWVSSSNGVIRYSGSKQKIDILKKDSNNPNSLSSNAITCFYEDFNGTIWVGTEKGVNILNNNNQFNSSNSLGYLYDKSIVSLLLHDEYLLIATKTDGIYITDRKTGDLLEHIYKNNGKVDLSNQYIKSLLEVNDDYVIAITNKGIISINVKESLYDYHEIEDGFASELNYAYNDGELIWLASTSKFYSYNIYTKEKLYYNNDLEKVNINPRRIKYILPDNKDKNILWLGGIDTGLVKYDKKKGVIEQYKKESNDSNSLINDYINCMTFDNSGNLWIGTNIGLSKFEIESNKFTSYTTSQGLTNNFINSILIDDNNNLWISTNRGLNKFDSEKEKLINFTKLDGLYEEQFNLNSSIKLENGIMIFGSTSGCTYFYPDDIVLPKINKNNVVIADIYVGSNKVDYNGDELILEHDNKDLSISYFYPNYENVNNITYEFKVEGIDSEWIYIESKNKLSFKTLRPGKYILKIRARGAHAELTEETKVNIRVKNSIWKTPFAYLTYISIIIVVVSCIIHYVKILQKLVDQKTIKLNKQLEENKKLSKEIIEKEKFKNKYFVNLSHELRTPINIIASTIQLINALNKDKVLTYEKYNEYMKIISNSCNNLLKIINDIIDSSKIETGQYKISKKNNDIVFVVEESALNMSKFIEEKGLSLIIEPDMEEKIISCDATEIERCVTNLLANAVKFTPEGGEIRVFIKEVINNIEIIIEDTGIGISKEDQEFIFKRFSQVEGTGATKASSSGIGLTLVKYITELHGGYVKLESEVNKGSRFIIGLPDILEDNIGNNEDFNKFKL